MAENSNIAWTDHTFNPWRGCTKVSPACDHCYAETMSKRNPSVLGIWGKYGTRSIAAESYWKLPEKWNRQAKEAGIRRKVFCASLADVFEGPESMPADDFAEVEAARIRLWRLINDTHWLDWLLLTKRPENIMPMIPERWKTACTFKGEPRDKVPANVWFGTTVENQKYADERIPKLLNAYGKTKFLSVEPMLGSVSLTDILRPDGGVFDVLRGIDTKMQCHLTGKIDWVICGGESGAGARPMDIAWVRSLIDQCKAAGVPFFMKQLGAYAVDSVSEFGDPDGDMLLYDDRKGGDIAEWPEDLRIRQFPVQEAII